MMDGNPENESNGYKCNSSNGATSDGTLRRVSFDSINESTNEIRNGKEEEEQGDNENKRKNS
jgi:hypothetical protein